MIEEFNSQTDNTEYFKQYSMNILHRNSAISKMFYNAIGAASKTFDSNVMFYEDAETCMSFEDGNYITIE